VRVEGVGLRAAVLLLAQQPAQLRVIRSPLLPAVEDLRDRTPPRPPRQRLLLTGTWLGHQLHPMLTDVPIGSWVSAGVLDLTAGPAASRAAQRLVGFGVLAAIPTAASGASDWSESYGSEQRVGLVHALGNVGALSLQLASYVARRRGHRGLGIALGTVGTGLTAAAGYLGGTLTLDKGMGVNHTVFEDSIAKWTDVASLAELTPGTPVRVSAGGVPVVLVRQGSAVRALSATCVHAGGPLDEGTVVDGCLRYPWHGSEFRLTDGKVMRGPAAASQPAWRVQVVDERVQVRSAQP